MTSFEKKNNLLFRIISGLLYAITFLYIIQENILIPFYVFIIILMLGSLYEFLKINQKFKQTIIFEWCFKTLGFIYIITPFLLLIQIKKLEHGEMLLLILILHVWATDIGGYIVGSLVGKRKLSNISPNKTWEGIIGSVLFCLIVSILLKQSTEIMEVININFMLLSFIICISSITGDLIVSKIKRINNRKNSGYFLPGHGGVLDRLDSLLMATPTYFVILLIS